MRLLQRRPEERGEQDHVTNEGGNHQRALEILAATVLAAAAVLGTAKKLAPEKPATETPRVSHFID